MLRQTWRRLEWAIVAVFSLALVVAAVVVLSLKFWLLPNVDRYRADVAAAVSRSVGLPVSLGKLEGDWVDFWPRIVATTVGFADSAGRQALLLPRIEAQLSWWSLLAGEIKLHKLEIDAPAVTVRRDADGRLFVAGLQVAGPEESGGTGFAAWVLHQPNVVVRDAVVQWLDARRPDNPLVMSGVMLRLESRGNRHRVGIQAQPPAALGHGLDLRGDVRDDGRLDPATWSGSLFAQLDQADLAALRPYVALPGAAQRGRGSWRVWFDFAAGKVTGAAAEVGLRDVALHLAPDVEELALASVSGRISFRDEGGRTVYAARGLTFQLPGEDRAPPAQDFELKLKRAADGRPTQVELTGTGFDFGRFVRLSGAVPLEAAMRERLAEARPTGRFDDIALDWRKESAADAVYRVKARFTGLGWRESNGLPGMQGVSGTLECDEGKGKADIRAGRTELSMARVFAAPLVFDRVVGKLSWKGHGGVTLDIGEFTAGNAEVELSARGSYRTLATGPGWIDLNATVARLDARAAWRYVPLVVNAHTRDWLRTSLLAGRGYDGKLRLQGNLAGFPFRDDRDGIFQIRAKVSGGDLQFSDSWPRIDRIEADLDFHGDRMQIDGHTARTLDSPLRRVRVVIPELSAPDNELDIEGESTGLAAEHLRYVMLSPIREKIHGATDNLVATGNGRLDLRLELPLARMSDGKVAGRYRFDGGTLGGAKASFPPLTGLTGELTFSESGLRADALRANVLGGPATIRLSSAAGGHLNIDAQGNASGADIAAHLHSAFLRQMTGKVDWKGSVVVRDGKGQVDLRAQGPLFGDQASAHVTSLADGGLQVEVGGRVDPRALATQFDAAPIGWIEGRPEVRGVVKVHDERTEVRLESDIVWLGEPTAVKIESTPEGAVRIGARGRIGIEALAKALNQPALRRLSGRTAYNGEFTIRDDATEVHLESTLEGIRSDLPAPLQKAAEDALPLAFDDRGSAAQRTATLRLGQLLAVKALRTPVRGQPDRWQRVAVAFGGADPALPDRDGIWLSGTMVRADFDQWRDLGTPAATAQTPAAASALPQVIGADLQVEQLAGFGRDFHNVGIRARRQERDWAVTLTGPELAGKATWEGEGKGRLVARLDNFVVPAAAQAGKAEARQERAPRTELPALDVVAERFVVRNRPLGRLEVTATNEGRDWRLERLRLVQPDTTLEATGLWRGVPVQSRTSLKIQLNSGDAGKLLGSLGYVDMVKRAPTQIKGDIAWDGSPFDFNPPTLDGGFRMDAKSGQFLKVDPGVGKLLGLISLQGLPRRIKLDFRDVFSDGFAFDSIGADVTITRGLLHTDNFEMKGPAAKVTMKGDVDLRSETQNVTARVSPSLGEGVAIATGVLGGPLAGAATLLVQKLLKNPLDRILSYEYAIGGSWGDPKVSKLSGGNAAARPNPTVSPR